MNKPKSLVEFIFDGINKNLPTEKSENCGKPDEKYLAGGKRFSKE
ncbi:MAG TPA: hypothetical protein PLW05_10435 [Candidatus Marinimicrobia bacterium]|nr:hypothetical protein [Candidatus Neomarinimicrobiota bacterium]HQE96410.1 hypothetical protein [Candidatus Neomarinimicrobiota bacterium]HQH56951.1 hypothetical protein [Candidatus Neomarinimicrobiota bacterium]HRS52927.1 hypothetical protein [Candidatus Neomarinimicrobiota bacterium]